MDELRSANTKINLENALNNDQKDRIITGTEKKKLNANIV